MNKVERVIRYEINEIVGGYEVEFDNKVINKGEMYKGMEEEKNTPWKS